MKTSLASMVGVAVVSAVVGLSSSAQAEVFKDKSGLSLCTPSTSSEEILKRPDGSTVRKTTGACIVISDLPFPFDYRKLVCSSTSELAADGKLISSHGYCEVFSTKGDRYAQTTVYDAVKNQGQTTYFDGSGAYAGIKGGAAYKVKAAFPGGGSVIEFTASWQTDGATTSK